MKERPILFSGPMVRAILSGNKTQTRRILKPQPCELPDFNIGGLSINIHGSVYGAFSPDCPRKTCPYGQPGDRLWVRETWAPLAVSSKGAYYRADIENPKRGGWKPSIHMPRWASRITLEVTGARVERLQDISRGDAIAEGVDWKRCPTYQSIESFTEQRLAQKLGMACFPVLTIDYIGGYKRLWESINGPGSWNENPWVWVVEFRKVDHIPGATKKV